MACSRLLSGSERCSSGDKRMRRVKDQDEEGGPGDQEPGTRGPRDQSKSKQPNSLLSPQLHLPHLTVHSSQLQ